MSEFDCPEKNNKIVNCIVLSIVLNYLICIIKLLETMPLTNSEMFVQKKNLKIKNRVSLQYGHFNISVNIGVLPCMKS